MMISSEFKKPLLVSAVGHLLVFSLLTVSFGPRFLQNSHSEVSFLGEVLSSADFKVFVPANFTFVRPVSFSLLGPSPFLKGDVKRGHEWEFNSNVFTKPSLQLTANNEVKRAFKTNKDPASQFFKKQKQTMTLYPQIPVNFLLYFKDRQIAHVELMFYVGAKGKANTLTIKRKSSSGNLEMDLLIMRYIQHYLSLQQAMFPLNEWQTLKVELSAVEKRARGD